MPYDANGGGCWTSLRKDCLTPTDWSILSSQGIQPSDNPGSDYILYIPYCNSIIDSYSNITNSCVFDFAQNTFFSFLQYFNYAPALNQGLFLNGTLTGDLEVTAEGPADLYYLYNAGSISLSSITAAFTGLANTMTARVRVAQPRSNYSAPAQGAIFYTQTLIRVEWQWLTLPLVLVVLTLLFIITVIIQTSINGRKPLGKTLSLSLLITGVAGQVSDKFQDTSYWHMLWQDVKGLKDSQEQQKPEVQIQMKKTEEGDWRLVKL